MKKKSFILFVLFSLLLSSCVIYAQQERVIDKNPTVKNESERDTLPCCGRLGGGISGNVITFRSGDNMMLLNGEPFFPIGVYRAQYGEPWNSNNVYTSDICGFLDDMEVMSFFGQELFESFDEHEYQLARQCLDHPLFLGWHSKDEPVWQYDQNKTEVTFDDLLWLYNRIKEDDPNHTVWMNFAPADVTKNLSIWIQKRQQYTQATDIVSCDVYPIGWGGGPSPYSILENRNLSKVGDCVDLLIHNVTLGEKPVWMVPQAWGPVNEGQIRFQSYQAIIHGATGIFYWWCPNGWSLKMPDAENVARELTDLHDVLVAPTVVATVTTTPGIETMVKEVDGGYYILAVSREPVAEEGVTAEFDLTSLGITHDGYAKIVNEEMVVDVVNGLFSLDFGPFDTNIIRFEDWLDYNWSCREKIVIGHTQVQVDLTDFPVLVSRDSIDALAAYAQDDGGDIVFAGPGILTRYDHEIEYYNDSTGELVAWVRIPYLSSTNDTVLYMYYGNPNCGNQENLTGVWDSNYVMVQHLNETSVPHEDSTNYDNDGNENGGVNLSAVGKIDGADEFAGDDDYIEILYSTSLNITDAITLEAWVQCDHLDTPRNIINARTSDFGPYLLQVNNSGFEIGVRLDGEWNILATTGYSPDPWYYVVGTYDRTGGANNLKVYVNSQVNQITRTGSIDTSLENRTIGHNYGYEDRWFDGIIDEIRISNIARNSSWIETSFNNQNCPYAFMTIGDEEKFDTTVHVDDDYNKTTPRWGYDYFDTIQGGIDAVTENGTVYVSSGTYDEQVVINKTVTLIGEASETTILDGGGNGDVVSITADRVHMSGFTVQNSGSNNAGVSISSEDTSVSENVITNNYNGICISFEHAYNSIMGNTITQNSNCGIYQLRVSKNTITENNVTSNNYHNIALQNSSNNTIMGNTFTGSITGSGIWLENTSNNTIDKNNITDNQVAGILVEDSSNSTITRNTITDNSYGIRLVRSHNSYVYHNRFNNTENAFDNGWNNQWDSGYLYGACPRAGNWWSNYSGVDAFSGPEQNESGSDGIGDTPYTIPGGSQSQDKYPLMEPWVGPLSGSIYVDNDRTDPPWDGTPEHPYQYIHEGVANAVSGDTVFVSNGTYYERVIIDKTITMLGEHKDTTVIDAGEDRSNVGVYISADSVNISGFTIQKTRDSTYHYGVFVSSDNNVISFNNITNNSRGITLTGSSKNCIADNSITDNGRGIWVSKATNNEIVRNTICSNERGIFFAEGKGSNVTDNTISNNDQGIWLFGSFNNNFSRNNISSNFDSGIHFDPFSDNNIITDNAFISNGGYGIYILDDYGDCSIDNLFYHNNFIDNNQNAYDECENIWGNSYPAGGNYWSDYTGDDLYHGPHQNISGGDGIGDTPYNIPGGSNQDKYPSMKPWGRGFQVEGCCHYPDMSPANNIAVEITNLNTSVRWHAGTYNNYYALPIVLDVDVNESDTLRIIAQDGNASVNITDHVVTSSEINAGVIRIDLTLDVHYRDLKEFPFYPAETGGTRDVDQMTGAAAAQMMLNYLTWNKSQNPQGPPVTYDNQTWIYERAHENNTNTSLGYIDTGGMESLFTSEIGNHGYGYHFFISHNDTWEGIALRICSWLDFNVSTWCDLKGGHPAHIPVLIPAYGDYSNWMTIRGIHTNKNTDPYLSGPPSGIEFYGFWVNDPLSTGIGENTYKTAEELFNYYYSTLDVDDDPHNGEYVAVTEPPEGFDEGEFYTDSEAAIVSAPAQFTWKDARIVRHFGRIENAGLMNNVAETTIANAARRSVETLRTLDSNLDNYLANAELVKTILVPNAGYSISVFYRSDVGTTAIINSLGNGRLKEISNSPKPASVYLSDLGVANTGGVAYASYQNGSLFYPTVSGS